MFSKQSPFAFTDNLDLFETWPSEFNSSYKWFILILWKSVAPWWLKTLFPHQIVECEPEFDKSCSKLVMLQFRYLNTKVSDFRLKMSLSVILSLTLSFEGQGAK